MRIIAGKYKKSTLNTLEGDDITRPTRDMVKEALFSSITIHNETVFLDLFSGSGAIGLEALSRGCRDVIFNDANRKAYGIIKSNLRKFNEERTVYNDDYALCLKKLKGYQFDYVFLDPPYAFREYDSIFQLLEEFGLLKDDGIIIAETRKDTILADAYGIYGLYKEKKYGISKLLYYRKKEEND